MSNSNQRKLYKSSSDRKIAGVCGGIAEYLNVDSTLVRLATAVLVLVAGSGPLAYILAALIIPEAPEDTTGDQEN